MAIEKPQLLDNFITTISVVYSMYCMESTDMRTESQHKYFREIYWGKRPYTNCYNVLIKAGCDTGYPEQ